MDKDKHQLKKYSRLLDYKMKLFWDKPINKYYRDIRLLKRKVSKLKGKIEIAELQKEIVKLKARLAKAKEKM